MSEGFPKDCWGFVMAVPIYGPVGKGFGLALHATPLVSGDVGEAVSEDGVNKLAPVNGFVFIFAVGKLMLGVPRGAAAALKWYPVDTPAPVKFMFTNGFGGMSSIGNVRGCGSPTGVIVAEDAVVGRDDSGADGLCGDSWYCRGSEEFCAGSCSEMSSSHTPPLLGIVGLVVSAPLADERRGCETARAGGAAYRGNDGETDELAVDENILLGIFSGVFSGGGGGAGEVSRSTGAASLDDGVDLLRGSCVDAAADAILGGGTTAFPCQADGGFLPINRLYSYFARMNFSSSLSLSVPIRSAGGGCRASSGLYS